MKVKVLFFAGLRESLGTAAIDVELASDAATLGALRAHLRSRGPAYESALGEKRALRMAVNQQMAQPSAALKSGDEVAFFPPVTGG